MIAKPPLSRAEKAAAQRAAKAEKQPCEGRSLIFEKGRGSHLLTIFKRKGDEE